MALLLGVGIPLLLGVTTLVAVASPSPALEVVLSSITWLSPGMLVAAGAAVYGDISMHANMNLDFGRLDLPQ